MVLVVHAIAKVQRALVVDLAQHDRPCRPDQRRQALAHGFQPTIGFVQERDAGVARHGERQRRHGQHHWFAAWRARLASLAPDHPLRDAEISELGVDVRPGTHDGEQAQAVRGAQETHHVEPRIAHAEVQAAVGLLVHTPRHVHVDDVDAQALQRGERGQPFSRVEPPIVHAAGDQRHFTFAQP